MSTYVLVHGSFHGGWCWEKIVPQLVKAGHKVHAGDLPQHGEDETSISAVTMQSYVDTVVKWVQAAKEPVILVGHSFGGMVISQVAERAPEQVKALVYLCALVPQNGQNAFSIVGMNEDLAPNVIMNEAEGWVFVREEAIPGLYYNDCSPEDIAATMARLKVEPLKPYFEPVTLTAEQFGQVPRHYIGGLKDVVVTPADQEKMIAQTPMQSYHTLNTSHSPFLSAPSELAEILLSLAPVAV